MQNTSLFYYIKPDFLESNIAPVKAIDERKGFQMTCSLLVHLEHFFFSSTDTPTMIYALCFRTFTNNDMRRE